MTIKDEQIAPAQVKREGFSAVWLIPVIALIFGAWLLYKAISEEGISIRVQFDSASGIMAGKTGVRYKGLTVGMVKDVEVSQDLKSVNVEIEMIPSASSMLTEKTLFWYVTANVSMQGVKGLDTLLSGSYINIQPELDEAAESQRNFIALTEEPDIDMTQPGLHVILQTDSLGSLGKSSPVTFKQISVGFVESFKYNESSNKVDVGVFIKPEFASLVKENSRFWNASGINVSASLSSGIEVNTDSLASVIMGGIAFDNSEHDVVLPPAESGQTYPLFSNFKSAEMGHTIELTLEWNSGIDIGSTIMYQGLTLGKVLTYRKIDPVAREIIAEVSINPRAIPYLTENTEFYVVSPSFDLAGMSNMSGLVMGSHIGVRFSLSGEQQSSFKVFNQKPAYNYSEPGVHLVLTSPEIGSLSTGSGIFYNQQQVGTVQAIENLGPDAFHIHLHIKPAFEEYVAKDSRFWNVSGIRIEGGLQGFEIQAQSLQSVIKGGIAFDKGMKTPVTYAENGDKFKLFSNKESAKQRIEFELSIATVKDISGDTRILHRGEEIGSIHYMERHAKGTRMVAGIHPQFEYLLKENTQFWLVKPQISLAGFSDTDALFGGSYLALNAGEGSDKKSFNVSLTPPAKHHGSSGLQLTLNAESGNVVNPGSAISYRGIAVGQVDNVAIDAAEDKVNINITVDEKYQHLINGFSRFYNSGGITVSGGIGNFEVKTESADAMLKGGISFYNPTQKNDPMAVSEGEIFQLYNSYVTAKQAGQAISIYFKDTNGLKANMPIEYQGQNVGTISRLVFDENDFGATAVAYLNDSGRRFAVQGSMFWLAQPELGLVGSKNIASILTGGIIKVIPGQGELKTDFSAEDIAPVITHLTHGLSLKLTTSTLGSIRVGNPVLYRQVVVGKVIGTTLAPSADHVEIYINIVERFAPLVKSDSQFWNTSGLQIDGGLFSGVQVDSESIETLIAGGIAFATPEKNDEQISATQQKTFVLHDEAQSDWHEWQAKIDISEKALSTSEPKSK